jgi:hypothetical protein
MPPPGIGQYPSRSDPTTGVCGMFNSYGLIGFFDKTVGAVVKRLLGMRDACIPGYTGVGGPTTGVTPGVTPGTITPGTLTPNPPEVMPQFTPRMYR